MTAGTSGTAVTDGTPRAEAASAAVRREHGSSEPDAACDVAGDGDGGEMGDGEGESAGVGDGSVDAGTLTDGMAAVDAVAVVAGALEAPGPQPARTAVATMPTRASRVVRWGRRVGRGRRDTVGPPLVAAPRGARGW